MEHLDRGALLSVCVLLSCLQEVMKRWEKEVTEKWEGLPSWAHPNIGWAPTVCHKHFVYTARVILASGLQYRYYSHSIHEESRNWEGDLTRWCHLHIVVPESDPNSLWPSNTFRFHSFLSTRHWGIILTDTGSMGGNYLCLLYFSSPKRIFFFYCCRWSWCYHLRNFVRWSAKFLMTWFLCFKNLKHFQIFIACVVVRDGDKTQLHVHTHRHTYSVLICHTMG